MNIKIEDVKKIAIEAGKIIEKYFYIEIDVNYKLDETPVTIADIETNNYLRKHLLELFPQAGWLSEEDKDEDSRLNQEYIWIVDPLDGTKDFSEKRPEVAISIALVKNNKPVLGCVYNPITKEGGVCSIEEGNHFWGFEKKDNHVNLDSSRIVVSRSEFDKGKLEVFHGINIIPLGSVANKLMRVAGGADDFYFSVSPKSEWDIAGGYALLESTGKIYQRFDNKPLIFNQEHIVINSGTLAGTESLVNQFKARFDNQLKNIAKKFI